MGRWVAYGRTRKFTKARVRGTRKAGGRVVGVRETGDMEGLKAFVSAGMRRRTARGSEGRLHSNGVAARKGPRGFCVFGGSRLGRGLDLPQNTQKRPSADTEEHRRELGRGIVVRQFFDCSCLVSVDSGAGWLRGGSLRPLPKNTQFCYNVRRFTSAVYGCFLRP